MDDYLPPIVTKLKGDWSDLRTAFLESLFYARAWADSMHAQIVNGLRKAGHDGGLAFADALKETTAKELLEGFDEDIGRKMGDQASKMGTDAGGGAARSFASAFSGIGMPLMIAAVVAFTPMLVTAIGAAITTAFGLGIVGLGIFLVRQQPAVVQAAMALKDTLKNVFTDAAMPFVPQLVEAMQRLSNLAKELGPDFKEIFTAIAPAVTNIADGIRSFMRELMPGLKAAAPLMGDMVAAFATLGGAFGEGLSGFLLEMVKVGPELWQFMLDVGEVIRDLLPMVGAFVAMMAQVYDLFEHGALKPLGLMGMVENLTEAWPKVVFLAREAWEWITKVAGAVGDWVSGKAGDVADWWNGMVEAVQTKGQQVAGWFQALPGRVGGWLAALPGKMRDAAVSMFDAFFMTLGFGAAKILQGLQFLTTLPQRIGLIAVQMWEGLKAKTIEGAENTGRTITEWAERIPVILNNLWLSFVAWGQRTWESVTSWVHVTVTDVLKWWDSLPGRISAANDKIVSTIKSWAEAAKNWLFQAGKDIVMGFINGVMSATQAAIDAVKRAIQKIIDGANSALDRRSPSRVFAAMGRDSMLGYVQGLTSEQGMLARAWTGLTPNRPVIGSAAGTTAAAVSGGDERPILVQLILDGDVIDERLVERAQRRKMRTGVTGYA